MQQIPEEIKTAIAQGRASRAAKQAAEDKAEADREAAEKARLDAAWAKFEAAALPLLPDYLRPYAKGDRVGALTPVPVTPALLLTVPGLAPFKASMQDERRPALTNFAIPQVRWAERAGDENEPYYDWSQWFIINGLTDPAQATACAAEQAEKMTESVAKWQVMNEQADARQTTQASAEAEQANQEETEARKLLNALRADPVAAAMLKAFVALQAERAGVRAQIESLSESFDNAQETADTRISQLSESVSQAQRAASDAQRKADDAAYDAERKIKSLRREIN